MNEQTPRAKLLTTMSVIREMTDFTRTDGTIIRTDMYKLSVDGQWVGKYVSMVAACEAFIELYGGEE